MGALLVCPGDRRHGNGTGVFRLNGCGHRKCRRRLPVRLATAGTVVSMMQTETKLELDPGSYRTVIICYDIDKDAQNF